MVRGAKKSIDENGNYFKMSQSIADEVYENIKKHIRIFNMENL